MVEKKYKSFLNVLLIMIIVAIIGIVGYVIYEYVYLRNIIDANASDILDAFDKYMNDKDKTQISGEGAAEEENETSNQQTANSGTNPTGIASYTNSATGYALTYKGYGVLGKIELPKVGLKYPILETMTNANAIDVSVAVQYGVRT